MCCPQASGFLGFRLSKSHSRVFQALYFSLMLLSFPISCFSLWILHSSRLWLSSLILKNVSLFYWALCLTQSRQAIYTCWRFASHSLNLTSFLSGKPWACMGYSFSCRTFYVNEMAPDTTQRFFSTLFSLSLQLPICSFHFLKQGIVFFLTNICIYFT